MRNPDQQPLLGQDTNGYGSTDHHTPSASPSGSNPSEGSFSFSEAGDQAYDYTLIGSTPKTAPETVLTAPEIVPERSSFERFKQFINNLLASPWLSDEQKQTIYKTLNYVGYPTLFLLMAFSEFGYASFSDETAYQSISDPLERYASKNTVAKILPFLIWIDRIAAYIDAATTITMGGNPKKAVEVELIPPLLDSLKNFQYNMRYGTAFTLNMGFTLFTFFCGSISPWTGMRALYDINQSDFSESTINILGPIMFAGQLVAYLLGYAPSVFSNPKKITDALNRQDKRATLKKLTTTREGVLFLLRTLISMTARGYGFYGLNERTIAHVFRISPQLWFQVLGFIAAAYQTLVSQGFTDFHRTFEYLQIRYRNPSRPGEVGEDNNPPRLGEDNPPQPEEIEEDKLYVYLMRDNLMRDTIQATKKNKDTQAIDTVTLAVTGGDVHALDLYENDIRAVLADPTQQLKLKSSQRKALIRIADRALEGTSELDLTELNCGKKLLYRAYQGWLFLSWVSVFGIRTAGTPSMVTGEIENPRENYTTSTACQSLVGAGLGAFYAHQYTNFAVERAGKVLEDGVIRPFFSPSPDRAISHTTLEGNGHQTSDGLDEAMEEGRATLDGQPLDGNAQYFAHARNPGAHARNPGL